SDANYILFDIIRLLALENNLLDRTKEAGIERYFLASCAKIGNLALCNCYYFARSLLSSILSKVK
ncbi:22240_t:CDS:1, partial [Cetraspora pellucida]